MPQFTGLAVAEAGGLLYLAAALLLGVPAEAQTPASRFEARLVEVPVVVLDRKSHKPVEDLKASDFVLLENGKPKPIEVFGTHRAGPAAGAVGEVKRPAASPATFSNRHELASDGAPVVAVLIDGYNSRFEDQRAAAQAVARVIEARQGKALWGVYLMGRGGIRVVHDYSSGAGTLIEHLLRPARGDAAGLGGLTGDWRSRGQTNDDGGTYAASARAEQWRRIQVTLAELRGIGRHLSGLPGRKSLIWLTTGVDSGLALGEHARAMLWGQTVEVLNDANVAVYAIDAEGGRIPQAYSAEQAASRGAAAPRPRVADPMEDLHFMGAMAHSTGGHYYRDSNGLARAVDESLADGAVFYRLAYRAPTGTREGVQLALKVSVPGRKGLEVRHRTTYTARTVAPLNQKMRDGLLDDAIVSPLDAVGIGAAARLTEAAGGEGSVLHLTFDPGSVTLSENGGKHQGRLDVRYVQTSDGQQILDDFTDEMGLNLTPAEAERTRTDGFSYQRQIQINAGARSLKIAFCDHVTGRLGSLRIELSDGGRGRLVTK